MWFGARALSGCMNNVRNAGGSSWLFLVRVCVCVFMPLFKSLQGEAVHCACAVERLLVKLPTILHQHQLSKVFKAPLFKI